MLKRTLSAITQRLLFALLFLAIEVSAQTTFVWTDSLIANRGQFAPPPPPESIKPDTIDGKLYWHGGVFVLPGTPDSILLAHGFFNVVKKPGSVMHDFFEATWPVEMRLSELPSAIRQVRYGVHPMYYPPGGEWKKRESTVQERICYDVLLFTVPGLPEEFFHAYGIQQNVLLIRGWTVEHTAYWPRDVPMKGAPPEFYNLDVPPLMELE